MSWKPLTLFRGTLDILILRTLRSHPLHGYDVSRRITELSDDAFQVGEGVLYPALRRLEERGWLRAEWDITGTGREARFYEITDVGREQLAHELQTWERYVEAMSQVLYPREAEA